MVNLYLPIDQKQTAKPMNSPAYTFKHVDQLVPYVRNSRTHSDNQVAKIAASIKEFGYAGTVVVRDGVIAKGHGTIRAIQMLIDAGHTIYFPPDADGNRTEVDVTAFPVLDASGWSEAQFRAYVIADNKTAVDAGWDDELLKVEFAEIMALDFDAELTGFSTDEIEAIDMGWLPEIDVEAAHGSNEDGVLAQIKIKTDQDSKQQAHEIVTNALDQAGIEYEIG